MYSSYTASNDSQDAQIKFISDFVWGFSNEPSDLTAKNESVKLLQKILESIFSNFRRLLHWESPSLCHFLFLLNYKHCSCILHWLFSLVRCVFFNRPVLSSSAGGVEGPEMKMFSSTSASGPVQLSPPPTGHFNGIYESHWWYWDWSPQSAPSLIPDQWMSSGSTVHFLQAVGDDETKWRKTRVGRLCVYQNFFISMFWFLQNSTSFFYLIWRFQYSQSASSLNIDDEVLFNI